MKKVLKQFSCFAVLAIFASCGGAGGGYYAKYTDKDGNAVKISGNVAYTYTGGIHINNFDGQVVQFQLEEGGDFQEEGMAGKTIKVMFYETDESLIWQAKEFDDSKTVTCEIESFEYLKEGMMDDKEYVLKGKFSNDNFKDGEFSLKVTI